jgi:adapter protein MecA 1/2
MGGVNMKFERIAPNKIKITLSTEDLKAWNLSFESLAYNSPEAQNMFWDLIRQAEIETGFIVDGSQLVVEAAPSRSDGFVMIITKVDDADNNPLQKYVRPKVKRDNKVKRKAKRIPALVFEFATFEDLTYACKTISDRFFGESKLFKHDNKFYLVCDTGNEFIAEDISIIMSEFAKSPSSSILVGVLAEYGQTLIDKEAVETINKHL